MNYGTIRISTNPSGATVHISRQNKGTTPIDIVNVMPGIYNITLSYPDLDSYNFDTVVIDGKMTVIDFDFISQEVSEEHVILTGTDLIHVPVPPGLQEELPPDMPPELPPGMPPEQPPGLPEERTITESRILEAQVETNRLLEKNNELLTTLLRYTAKTSGFDESERYFTQGYTPITVATPDKPENPDIIADPTTTPVTPGYDRILVNQVLNRNARTLTVTNDGIGTLYVISSSNGQVWNRDEIPISQGEYKRFFNVYELRVRAEKAGSLQHNIIISGNVITTIRYGGIYRITEFETESALFNVNRTAIFVLAYPNIPVVGVGIVTFVITGDVINTPVAFRSSVTNTNIIYVSYASGSTNIDAQRMILNPGDVLKANITKGASVKFAGASAGQRVELLQEEDLT